MEEQIREVNAQIKETAKEVSQLFALETTDKARFESKLVQEHLVYLRRKEESLRQEKLLLMAKDESTTTASAPAPPGNSITLPQVLPLASCLLLLLFLHEFASSTQLLNYKQIVDWMMREGGGFEDGLLWSGVVD